MPLWLISLPLVSVCFLASVLGWGVIINKLHLNIQTLTFILSAPLFFWDRKSGTGRIFPRLLIVVILIFAGFANVLEFVKYDNFLFQHFHLDPAGLRIFAGLAVALVIIKSQPKLRSIPVVFILVIFFFIQASAAGFIEAFARSVSRPLVVLTNMNMTPDQKMKIKYGPRYDFLLFVKNYLPSRTRLLLPPETTPWLYTGHTKFVRAVCFPLDAISFTHIDKNTIFNNFDYILLSSEESNAPVHTWPDFSVPASEIIIYNWETNTGKIYTETDYLPAAWSGKKVWGLIKIRKT